MKWVKFQCEECGRHYAVYEDQTNAFDRIEEPCCPDCGGTYSTLMQESDSI